MSSLNEHFSFDGFRIGAPYSRMDVARVGRVTPPKTPRDWPGIVRFKNCVLLFVTLDKEGFAKGIQYNDIFEDGGQSFLWESQNRNTINSPSVAKILSGSPTALFARIKSKIRGATQPFTYVGHLKSEAHEGEKPVKVLFEVLDYNPTPGDSLYNLYHWKEESSLHRTTALKRSKPIRRPGQGRSIDPEKKKAIEMYAMEMAKKHYEQAGFLVENTSENNPYDYECSKDEEIRRVEVKGTTLYPETVNVTYNEVQSARSRECETDLFIIYQIEVEKVSGEFVTSGGKTKLIRDWHPEDSDLVPTAFTYTVPN